VPVALSDDPRDFVARDWSALVTADPAGTFFHSPRYLKLYWEEFGQDTALVLAFAERDGETVGACAFEMVGETLRFLGGTEVSDYMGPVAAPGAGDEFATELVDAILGAGAWRTADLRGLPEDSPWLPRLRGAAEARGLAVEEGDDSVAPFLALTSTFEQYLAGLPGKLRHEIRRKARRLDEELGGHGVAFADPASLVEDLGTFMAWHRASEGSKGKFMQPGMEIFFRRLGEAFLPEGVFRLGFLEAEGRKLAGAIAFAFEGTVYLYNSAFDRERRDLAPGMVLVADLIENAIAEGCDAFDMLKGDLSYKYRFGARPRRIRRLVLTRPG
jgi:CelD/BcsL family acetyltransferase involved in cellulose biosynthesis